jgi:hypothetical protein
MNMIAGWMMPERKLRPEARLVEVVVVAVEDLLRLGALAKDLNEGVARMHLFDVAVQGAGPFPLGRELALRAARDQERHHDRQRHCDERDQGEQPADPDHDREDADDREHRGHDLAQALRRVVPMLSTSLVTRLKTSPWG